MLLKKPDQATLRALAHLEGDPNFRAFRSYLEAQVAENAKNLAAAQDVAVCRWRQGVAQTLDEVLTTIATARNYVK